MSLFGGDLTTPQRAATWMGNAPVLPSAIISQLVTSMSRLIVNKLNRASLYSQTFRRTFDGVGNMQLVLPDYPVTSIAQVQMGMTRVLPSIMPEVGVSPDPGTSYSRGFRYIPWAGDLPGDPAVIEFANGFFFMGPPQNIRVTYTAGYLVSDEPWTIPPAPSQVTVIQAQGIWCRDNGVTYADGTPLTPVTTLTGAAGEYIAPLDAAPGLYTFGAADIGASVLISYSFIPADLEEAVNQMIAERYSYRDRIGEVSKSLGGQETIRWQRGSMGYPWNQYNSLPPEVNDLIQPYVSVIPPAIGAPV